MDESGEGVGSESGGPLTLGVETATPHRSVALLGGSRLLAERAGDLREGGASRLLADIDEVLREAGVGVREVELFAAAKGPGSFTGLRTGLATLLGLAVTLGRPILGIPTLHAVAASAGPSERVLAAIPAGRGEVFAQLLRVGARGRVEELEGPRHVSPARLFEELARRGGDLKLAGPGVLKYLEPLKEVARGAGLPLKMEEGAAREGSGGWSVASTPEALARTVALQAQAARSEGQTSEAFELRAVYVRPSDAELNEQWRA